MLDSRYHVETPEGIDLLLQPAGALPRALAFAVDLLIRAGILALTLFLLAMLSTLGTGLFLIVFFAINWLYMVLFEVLNHGRSPGKQLLGLKVVNDDGTRIGWSSSLVRNLLRAVDSLPIGYATGLLCSFMHPRFKRLGDIAAGTLVVYQDQPLARQSLPNGPAMLSPITLSQEEQRAIISFAERQQQLSPERRLEVASLLSEALQVHPAVAEDELHRIARGLLGAT